MELGVCTWIFGDVKLEQVLPAVARCGVDGIELLGDLRPAVVVEVRRLLTDEDLSAFRLPRSTSIGMAGRSILPIRTTRSVGGRLTPIVEMLDLAANVGASILGCHGRVGRVHALAMQAEEVALLTDSVRRVAEHAATPLGIRVAFEVLNRYETHLVCHVEAALGLVSAVEVPDSACCSIRTT